MFKANIMYADNIFMSCCSNIRKKWGSHRRLYIDLATQHFHMRDDQTKECLTLYHTIPSFNDPAKEAF